MLFESLSTILQIRIDICNIFLQALLDVFFGPEPMT